MSVSLCPSCGLPFLTFLLVVLDGDFASAFKFFSAAAKLATNALTQQQHAQQQPHAPTQAHTLALTRVAIYQMQGLGTVCNWAEADKTLAKARMMRTHGASALVGLLEAQCRLYARVSSVSVADTQTQTPTATQTSTQTQTQTDVRLLSALPTTAIDIWMKAQASDWWALVFFVWMGLFTEQEAAMFQEAAANGMCCRRVVVFGS